jgi:hypothetical protein
VSLHKPINPLQALWPIESSRFWEGVGVKFPALLDYAIHPYSLSTPIFANWPISTHGGVCACGLGFSSGSPPPNGAGLGSLSFTASKVSWFWGAVCSNFREIFLVLPAKFVVSRGLFGLWNDSFGRFSPQQRGPQSLF